jgi:hypothetical protein
MRTEITLNKADILEIITTLKDFDIDHFKLIKEDSSGIGYTLCLEYPHSMNGKLVYTRIEIVGPEEW